MKDLIIFGAGGLGREIRSMLIAMPEWNVKGYYDDAFKIGDKIGDLSILGGLEELNKNNTTLNVVIAIGDSKIKSEVASKLKPLNNLSFPSIIHPGATLQDKANIKIGEGSIIGAGSILTTSIDIGKFVLINLNCTVGHDTTIGDFTSIMPGVNLAGNIKVGRSILIGSGSQLINQVIVGDGATIGAGSVVLKNVSAGKTVVGVPAKELNR